MAGSAYKSCEALPISGDPHSRVIAAAAARNQLLNLSVFVQHIDTAVTYRNEHAVGEALGEYLKAGKVKRKDLFVTTKLWSNQKGREQVEPAVRESLRKLQLDYLDLLLIHWPVTDQPGEDLRPTAEVSSPPLCLYNGQRFAWSQIERQTCVRSLCRCWLILLLLLHAYAWSLCSPRCRYAVSAIARRVPEYGVSHEIASVRDGPTAHSSPRNYLRDEVHEVLRLPACTLLVPFSYGQKEGRHAGASCWNAGDVEGHGGSGGQGLGAQHRHQQPLP